MAIRWRWICTISGFTCSRPGSGDSPRRRTWSPPCAGHSTSTLRKADNRRAQLEVQFNQGQGELNTAMELADLYRKLNLEGQFQGLTMSILNDTNIPPNAYLAVAKMYADAKRMDLLATALEKYLAREPANPKVWIDLAAIQAAMQKSNECVQSLKRAIELGGEPVRDVIRKDPRFNPVRENREFKALVPPIQQQGLPMNLPGMPML